MNPIELQNEWKYTTFGGGKWGGGTLEYTRDLGDERISKGGTWICCISIL